MNQDQIIQMLHKVVAENQNFTTWTVSTPHLVALVQHAIAEEREAIAKMIEDAPALMDFARNDRGGCLMCGFTPKLAAQFIRARNNT